MHAMKMTIAGSGRITTPRGFLWFSTQKTIQLVHESQLLLLEEIVSTDEELDQGIIKSEYRIQRMDEHLGHASVDYQIGKFSSADLFRDVKTICDVIGNENLQTGVKLLQKFSPFVVDIGLSMLHKFLVFMDEQVNPDGTILVSSNLLKKYFPEYNKLVAMTRDFRGTVIKSEWVWGKGYTSIVFEGSDLAEADKEALAKLIYRTNPIAIRDIFPDGKKEGDQWVITSDLIGGIVYSMGLDFDTVEGAIQCAHGGDEKLNRDQAPDEYELIGREPLNVENIRILQDSRNLLQLVSKSTLSDIAIAFSPYGTFTIYNEHDSTGRHLMYLREAHLQGSLKSKVSRRTSLLQDVEFRENDLIISIEYSQIRMK